MTAVPDNIGFEPEASDNRVRVVAITGANGCLGSAICSYLDSLGWDVVKLVRSVPEIRATTVESPRRLREPAPTERIFDLSKPVVAETLEGVDLLIHAAYDLTLTSEADIWRVNVDGTESLLRAAHEAGVTRVFVLSSMSAYQGTRTIYGRARLAIERLTSTFGGCSLRAGLVYSDQPRGMAGALHRMTRLPIVPVPTGDTRQFPVHEDDFLHAVGELVTRNPVPPGPLGLASTEPVAFRTLLEGLAGEDGRRLRFVSVPWQFIYCILRLGELFNVRLPFRSDSLLGLVRAAPFVPGTDVLREMGITFPAFTES
jgi:nucleoside-diphosphate-sugar epimerase